MLSEYIHLHYPLVELATVLDWSEIDWLSCVPFVPQCAMHAVPGAKYDIACHENEIPPFVEPELDRLYGARYASIIHFRVYGGLNNTHTYVCQVDGQPITIFLFRIEKQTVQVLNEGIRLASDDIQRFADYIFSRYGHINRVSFRAIEKDERCLNRPCQSVFFGSDMRLPVPASSAQYHRHLGKNTRQGINQSIRKLKKSFPSFDYHFGEREMVHEHDIRTILDFNRARRASRGEFFAEDEDEIRRIIEMARACGLVLILTIDGRMCGGTITYRFGDNFAFRATGYDLAYDRYRLGFVANFLTFVECIDRGANNIHLGWGRQDYKFALGGVERDLEDLLVFRSWARYFLGWNVVLQLTIQDKLVKSRQCLLVVARRRDGAASSLARAFLASVRRLRQLKQVLF